MKQKQYELIQRLNPATDDIHTWVRSPEEIKSFEETEPVFTPDFTPSDAETSQHSGVITVYSSYQITPGVFVTPSKMEAEAYAGDGPVYVAKVRLEDVAWIDMLQGMYAPMKRYQELTEK